MRNPALMQVYVFPRLLLLVRYAGSPVAAVRIVLVAILMLFKHWLPARWRSRPVALPLKPWGKLWVTDRSELRAAHEVFVERVYDLPALPDDAAVVLDLGANAGFASVFFAQRYPDAKVIAYEADPLVVERARRNCAGYPRVEVRVAAVGDADGTMTLRRAADDSWATSEFGTGEEFTTTARSLAAVVGEHDRIDILKMDIEGSEYAAIRSCPDLTNVRVLVGELHTIPGQSPDAFFASLDGFDLVSDEIHDGQGTFIATSRTSAAPA